MNQEKINKTKKIVIPAFLVLFTIGVIETLVSSNEHALSNFVLSNLLIPIIILSTLMSGYWILLTEDFWDIYEGLGAGVWAYIRTGLKFLIWVPGMGLCFFLVFQGLLSIYNRSGGQEKFLIVGQVVDKSFHTSKGTSRYYLEIDDQTLGRKVTIKVPRDEYDAFGYGDKVQIEKKLGIMGFVYE